jgi:hypothetical protein
MEQLPSEHWLGNWHGVMLIKINSMLNFNFLFFICMLIENIILKNSALLTKKKCISWNVIVIGPVDKPHGSLDAQSIPDNEPSIIHVQSFVFKCIYAYYARACGVLNAYTTIRSNQLEDHSYHRIQWTICEQYEPLNQLFYRNKYNNITLNFITFNVL